MAAASGSQARAVSALQAARPGWDTTPQAHAEVASGSRSTRTERETRGARPAPASVPQRSVLARTAEQETREARLRAAEMDRADLEARIEAEAAVRASAEISELQEWRARDLARLRAEQQEQFQLEAERERRRVSAWQERAAAAEEDVRRQARQHNHQHH